VTDFSVSCASVSVFVWLAPVREACSLRQADRVITVGSADPIGLSRFLRAHVELLEHIETAQVSVVINRLRASAVGAGAQQQVRQTLHRFGGLDDPTFLPLDVAGVDAAVLSGKTVHDAAPRSGVCAGIAQLVDSAILPPSPSVSRKEAGRASRRAGTARPLQTLRARRLG
jgi:hypothetical protein